MLQLNGMVLPVPLIRQTDRVGSRCWDYVPRIPADEIVVSSQNPAASSVALKQKLWTSLPVKLCTQGSDSIYI